MLLRLPIHQKHYDMDMTSGPLLPKMLSFALPLMASSILQLLFNAADIIVVGKFAGDASLAAVGSTTSLINLLTNFFLGLSVGVNVLVARYAGANAKKDLRDTVHTSMLLSAGSGILLLAVGCAGAARILGWMQSPDEVRGLAALYLRIYFLGMPAMMIYNFGAAILRAVGDTRRSLHYLLVSGILNVLLNLFFVIVLHMDVAGVAAATVISQCLSAGLILNCLIKEPGDIRLSREHLRFSASKMKRILRIGIPAGLQSILFSFSNVCIQASINSFGPVVVAGSAASSNIEGFVYIAMNSFYQATLSFTSQNIGAGKLRRVPKVMRCGICCAAATGLLLGIPVVLGGPHLLRLYTSSPDVISAAMERLAIVALPYFLCGMMDTMVGVLRGMGYAVMPMIVSLIGACGLRLIWIFTFFRLPRFHTTRSLYLTYPVTWVITFAAHLVCYMMIQNTRFRRFGHIKGHTHHVQ